MVVLVTNLDASLVARCREDDVSAFNEIVSRYKNKVYTYISRMVGPGADAEDLTQETFVRAYVNLKSFQSRSSLNTWLFRIATNICIDFSRKSGRIRAHSASMTMSAEDGDEELEREIPDSRFDPQSMLLNKELGSKLEQALAALPEKLRVVVLLHDIEGLQYEEIAAVVECPLGTVKSRLFNARVSLREKLLPYLDGNIGGGQCAGA